MHFPLLSLYSLDPIVGEVMDLKTLVLLLVLGSAVAQDPVPQTWVDGLKGFIAGLQRNPATVSSCQTLLPTLASKWEVAASSVVAYEGWDTLYDLRDFFVALDFWTQTCNFVTLLNYVQLNMSWNLLVTRIVTNLTFYAVMPT